MGLGPYSLQGMKCQKTHFGFIFLIIPSLVGENKIFSLNAYANNYKSKKNKNIKVAKLEY